MKYKVAFLVSVVSSSVTAVEADNFVNIYSNNYNNPTNITGSAIIEHMTKAKLTSDMNNIAITGLPNGLDTGTVNFSSITDPSGTKLVEMEYKTPNLAGEGLFEENIGKEITVNFANTSKTGTLISYDEKGLSVKDKSGITFIPQFDYVSFGTDGGQLYLKPALNMKVTSQKKGDQTLKISYQTDNIGWYADYAGILKPGAKSDNVQISFSGVVSFENKTGADFKNSKVKLIAGEINRASSPIRPYMAKAMRMDASEAASSFTERSFSDYHIYELNKLVDIDDGKRTRYEFIPEIASIDAKKEYLYNTQISDQIVTYLIISNSAKNKLGIPLPQGRIRISEYDQENLLLAGEDYLKHTPKDVDLKVRLGAPFDMRADRQIKDSRRNDAAKWSEEDIEIEVTNSKSYPVTLKIVENFSQSNNWAIKDTNIPGKKINQSQQEFMLNVKPGDKTVLRYTVHYNWQ